MSKRYFVFTKGNHGPEGQIFHEEVSHSGEGKKKNDYLFGPVEISHHETLDDCIIKYREKVT